MNSVRSLVILCYVMCEGGELPLSQSYHLFSTADEYSEPSHSEPLEQEMMDLITLQRLLNLAVDDTPGKVNELPCFLAFYTCRLHFLFM